MFLSNLFHRNICRRLYSSNAFTVEKQQISLAYSGWAFLRLFTDVGAGGFKKVSPLPKICLIYFTIMKLDTVIHCLKKTQKMYESSDPTLEFCWHQHFLTRNQQILLYQEVLIYFACWYIILMLLTFFSLSIIL